MQVRTTVDLNELRHFCAAWLFNDHELPAQDGAHQLGHTVGCRASGLHLRHQIALQIVAFWLSAGTESRRGRGREPAAPWAGIGARRGLVAAQEGRRDL